MSAEASATDAVLLMAWALVLSQQSGDGRGRHTRMGIAPRRLPIDARHLMRDWVVHVWLRRSHLVVICRRHSGYVVDGAVVLGWFHCRVTWSRIGQEWRWFQHLMRRPAVRAVSRRWRSPHHVGWIMSPHVLDVSRGKLVRVIHGRGTPESRSVRVVHVMQPVIWWGVLHCGCSGGSVDT